MIRLPRVLSPNQNLQFLSWRMWAFFCALIEVHRWWHAQGNAFPHTPHHCQTPAVPVPLIFGAEAGWGWGVSEEMARFSLESLLFFSDDGVCLLLEDAAPVWLKEPRWMRHAKWCPEEKEPTEMLLPSSLPPAGNCDRGPRRWLLNEDFSFTAPSTLDTSFFFFSFSRQTSKWRGINSPQVIAGHLTVAGAVRECQTI